MAEVLAVVASGAGLASLVIQLADGIDRLRKRCEDLEKLRDNIGILIEDLELIRLQLQDLESDHKEILEFMTGPIVLGKCQICCEEVIKRLETLIAIIPIASSRGSKRRILRTLFESKKWKKEFNELRRVVWDLKLDLIRVQGIYQKAFIQKHILLTSLRNENSSKGSIPPDSSAVPNSQADEDNINLSMQVALYKPASTLRRQATQCIILHCHCSCHITKQVSSRFWYLQYTPLADMLASCDNARCTARRHRFHFRTALSQLGISWAVMLGVDLTVELGKFSLHPALQLQRVVKFTSPGFVTLWKLSENILGWDDAEAQFRDLYRSDPTFTSQVDPSGQGYLEKAMAAGEWTDYRSDSFDNLLRVLELFIKEFNTSLGLDSPGFMINCASFISESLHLYILDGLLKLGCDFNNTPAPHFESWPKPCPDDQGPNDSISIIPPDPFFIEYLRSIVGTNQDFGGTPPLHEAIWYGSLAAVQLLIQKSQPLEKNMNFLGQTPLHVAVCRPSRVKALLDAGHDINARDKNGITALMYAAAMNRPLAVAILIRRGADLFLRDHLEKYDFITYAAVRNNWSLVWSAVEVIESRDRGLLPRTFSRIISAPRPPLFLEKGRIWTQVFMVSVVSKMGMNVCFEDGRTLIHVVGLRPFAHMLIEHGFTAVNQQDHAGEHSLFAIAKFLDPQLFRLFLEKGADINLKNHKGHSVLRQVVDRLRLPREAEGQRLLDFLSMLLSNGVDVAAADNCACGCSSGGCLPISGLWLEVRAALEARVNNPFWIFEWLCMLKDHGKSAEAKSNALSVLRRVKFDEASLVHTCHARCAYGADVGSPLNEDTFWDISRVVELDKLNDEMGALEARMYNEIMTELMVHLKNLSMKKQEQISGKMDRAATPFQKENTTGQTTIDQRKETLDYEIDYKNDNLYSSFDMLFRPGGLAGILGDFDFVERDYTKECFDEYISHLRSARGGNFSGRMDLLSQLSNVLDLPVAVVDS